VALIHQLISLGLSCNIFSHGSTTPVAFGLLIVEVPISHSVWILWTSNQPVAETCTWKHKTPTTENIHASGSIRNPSPSMQAATDSRLRWRDNQDRHLSIYIPVMATWVMRADLSSLKTALTNKKIKWKVLSKNPAILVFPVSILYCQQSRGLFHNKYGQCTYNVTLKGVRATVVVMGKQRVLHNLNVCIFSPISQNAMRMRHIVICGLHRSTTFFYIIS